MADEDERPVHARPFPWEARVTRCCYVPIDALPEGHGTTYISSKETCGR